MKNEGFSLYRYWLIHGRRADREYDKEFVKDSFESSMQDSPAYQEDATRNGEPQPLVAQRTETKKCKVTLMPGDDMNIGDLIYVFNEHWLCMSVYVDEYGMRYGEIWMCNQIFHYQDHSLKQIDKYAIIDDGSYAKGGDKAIPLQSNFFRCYISQDEESAALYVDKRLGVDVVRDSDNKEILKAGKIMWLDTRSNNFGKGSHLLEFGLADDVYNAEHDNIELRICDYITPPIQEPEKDNGHLVIDGNDAIRIGTSRTYRAAIEDGSDEPANDMTLEWSIAEANKDILLIKRGVECVLQVGLNDDLIGNTIILNCVDATGKYAPTKKEVVVISIG